MNVRRLAAASIVIAGVIGLTACSGDDGGSSSVSTVPSTPSTSPSPTLDPVQARKYAAEDAARKKAEADQAKQKVGAVKKEMRTVSSRNEQLGIILTEYCTIIRRVNALPTDEAETAGLIELYEASWRAGRWNATLKSAAAQQGACPDVHPYAG